jgi:RiboL-PSP-HEPN
MKNLSVFKEKQRLDNTFKLRSDFLEDPELQAHWARYLCVLTSGFLESSIRHLLGDYSRKQASPSISNFVEYHLNSFQNPKSEKILELLKVFNPSWETLLRQHMEGERKDAVDSIVNNRHQIAHGRNAGISYVTMKRYYEKSSEVIEFLDDLLG